MLTCAAGLCYRISVLQSQRSLIQLLAIEYNIGLTVSCPPGQIIATYIL